MIRPDVLVFDVNGTLSDLAPLADRFAALGLPADLATLWFTTVLRDGSSLAAAGSTAGFADIAANVLRGLLAGHSPECAPDEVVEHVLAGFLDLPVHPDVPDGVRALRAAGFRLVTLSNGSVDVGERLLSAAGIRDEFEALLSVDDAGIWKPAPGAYEYALRECGVAPGEAMLVAAHPWDVHGAARAGLRTTWLDRDGRPYPGHFAAPDQTVAALTQLPAELAAG